MPPKTLDDLERTYDSFYVPTFEIAIEGETKFSPAAGRASSVRVQTAIEKANRVSFDVSGVYDQAAGDFTGLDDTGLEIGNSLEVEVGYGSTTERIMTGRITDVKPTFSAGGAPTVKVVGHDHRYHMDQASADKSWDNTTVEAATEAIADKYDFERVEIGTSGPDSSGSISETKLEQLVQDSQSDLAFLKQLVRTYNYEMFSHGGVLWFREPADLEGSHDASVRLTYAQGLRSFQRQAGSERSRVGTVRHAGVNPRTGEEVSGTRDRSASQGSDEERLLKAPMESDEEAENRSKSKANELDHAQRSSATVIGLPDLRIGDWVELAGLGSIAGQHYDGTYYLHAVDHDFDGSGYATRLEMAGPIPE